MILSLFIQSSEMFEFEDTILKCTYVINMYTSLLHLINIHDLITPFHWSILLIDELFAVEYFRLFPYDLIPLVTVRVINQIPHGSIGKIWRTTSPRY